jgi:ribonuclease P protein component
MATFSLSKLERIKSIQLTTLLFAKGKSLFKHPFTVRYLLVDRKDSLHKFAASVPKRNFKKAVDRNYIKRLVREAYRKNKPLLPLQYLKDQDKTLLIMFIYIDKEKNDFFLIEKSIKQLLTLVQKELRKPDTV